MMMAIKRTIIKIVHQFRMELVGATASVLLDMNLPASQRLLSLLGFNAGVEIGQLAIVSVALLLISTFSQSRFYTLVVLKSGSAAITAVALFWLVERSLDVQFNLF